MENTKLVKTPSGVIAEPLAPVWDALAWDIVFSETPFSELMRSRRPQESIDAGTSIMVPFTYNEAKNTWTGQE
jgi:hypothetical protein